MYKTKDEDYVTLEKQRKYVNELIKQGKDPKAGLQRLLDRWMTLEWYDKSAKKNAIQKYEGEQERKGFLERAGEAIKAGATSIVDNAKDFEAKRAGLVEKEWFKWGLKAVAWLPREAVQNIGDTIGIWWSVAFEWAVSAVKAITPDLVENYVVEWATDKFNAFKETDTGKEAMSAIMWGMEAWNTFAENNPETAKTAWSLMNITDIIGIWIWWKAVKKWAKVVGEIAEAWADAVEAWAKSVIKTGEKLWEFASDARKALDEDLYWMNEAQKQAIVNNPYQADYWNQIKEKVDSEGALSEWLQQESRTLYDNVSDAFSSKLRQHRERLSVSWPLYSEIRELNIDVDMSPVRTNIDDILKKDDIIVKRNEAWEYQWLDFSKSKYIKWEDTAPIKWVYERMIWGETLKPWEILNLRKAIDSSTKYEWRPVSSTPLLKKIRHAVDEKAKADIPNLRELDDMYSSQMKEIDELENGLTYREWNRLWVLKDNVG